MLKKILPVILALFLCSGFKLGSLDMDKVLDAGSDAVTAATLTQAQMAEMGKQSADQLDKKNKPAPASNAYVQRLNKIMGNLSAVDGLKLNFKVYITKNVNAFALPDGSIRIYSGLMDLMTDDEIFFVLGHEIGHVKNGDSADKYRMAYTASAARKAASAAGGKAASLSDSELGNLGEAVLNAQFSQTQESDADLYGLKLLERYKRNTRAAVSALRKLADPGNKSGFTERLLSSHPDPNARADKIEALIKK
ncbi:MAG: M48 family metalloprotease [Deltaproteobacteria bacterium]|jgi:putative metalloprotease|nr:M48 family metalloprotease [Deltaproteobacteria bacterium]